MNDMPQDELLSAYLDGELSDEERAEVERLLAASPENRQLLDELRTLSASLRALPRYELEPDFGQRVLRRAERKMLASPLEEPEGGNGADPRVAEVRHGAAAGNGAADATGKLSKPRDATARMPESREDAIPWQRRLARSLAWPGAVAAAATLIFIYSLNQPERHAPENRELARGPATNRTPDAPAPVESAPQLRGAVDASVEELSREARFRRTPGGDDGDAVDLQLPRDKLAGGTVSGEEKDFSKLANSNGPEAAAPAGAPAAEEFSRKAQAVDAPFFYAHVDGTQVVTVEARSPEAIQQLFEKHEFAWFESKAGEENPPAVEHLLDAREYGVRQSQTRAEKSAEAAEAAGALAGRSEANVDVVYVEATPAQYDALLADVSSPDNELFFVIPDPSLEQKTKLLTLEDATTTPAASGGEVPAGKADDFGEVDDVADRAESIKREDLPAADNRKMPVASKVASKEDKPQKAEPRPRRAGVGGGGAKVADVHSKSRAKGNAKEISDEKKDADSDDAAALGALGVAEGGRAKGTAQRLALSRRSRRALAETESLAKKSEADGLTPPAAPARGGADPASQPAALTATPEEDLADKEKQRDTNGRLREANEATVRALFVFRVTEKAEPAAEPAEPPAAKPD